MREAAAKSGLSLSSIQRFEGGERSPRHDQLEALATAYGTTIAELTGTIEGRVPRGTQAGVVREPGSSYEAGSDWPPAWRERTYALLHEAAKAGATEEELAVVKGWMLEPKLQALWAGGGPKDLSELDGIDQGARRWLRDRGKMVNKK